MIMLNLKRSAYKLKAAMKLCSSQNYRLVNIESWPNLNQLYISRNLIYQVRKISVF